MSNESKRLALAQLPECGVIGCREEADPQGGEQGMVLNITAGGRHLEMQSYSFLCTQHAAEFVAMEPILQESPSTR